MISSGIFRTVDHLGRVILPVEIRHIMKIGEHAPLEIFVDDKKIILKKYLPDCIICGIGEGLTDIEGKKVCKTCLEEIKTGG